MAYFLIEYELKEVLSVYEGGGKGCGDKRNLCSLLRLRYIMWTFFNETQSCDWDC